MRRYSFALPLLLAALAFTACGGSSGGTPTPTIQPPTPEPTEAATDTPTAAATTSGSTAGNGSSSVKVSGKLGSRPKITVPGGDPPTKLVIKDLKKGTGPAAQTGNTVTVQYEGVNFKDGKEFDASWNRPGQPFSFPLGAGQVIPGWDQGIAGMKKGGRRLLVIPPDLGYGPNGSPPAIEPNETLVFVVDMENITAD